MLNLILSHFKINPSRLAKVSTQGTGCQDGGAQSVKGPSRSSASHSLSFLKLTLLTMCLVLFWVPLSLYLLLPFIIENVISSLLLVLPGDYCPRVWRPRPSPAQHPKGMLGSVKPTETTMSACVTVACFSPFQRGADKNSMFISKIAIWFLEDRPFLVL